MTASVHVGELSVLSVQQCKLLVEQLTLPI